MGTGDDADLGAFAGASRGAEISLQPAAAARFARFDATFGNSTHGECANNRHMRSERLAGAFMAGFNGNLPGHSP
jgi:hypothetical protein